MSCILSRISGSSVRLTARLCVPLRPSAAEPAASPAVSTATSGTTTTPVRGICHKDHIDPEILRDKPPPFPYDRRKFGWLMKNLIRVDRAVKRWDENTVVICVEGLMGVGKHEFASQLSDLLGMRYYGMPDNEPFLVHDNGFDYRTLNWLLPESAQYCDQKLFYLNPVHGGVGPFLEDMYMMKYFHYLEGLTHLFNTGQGVVHEGSIWSDYVFHLALNQMGIIKKDVVEHHYDLFMDMQQTIHRPHVVIYLDVPAEEAMRRFLAKSPDYIKRSPVMTLDYFRRLEDLYKNKYLPEITKHAEVLIYDWREAGDMEMVVEDLETLDMVRFDCMTEKLEDWRHYKEDEYDKDRLLYTSFRDYVWSKSFQPTYDKPSCIMSVEASKFRKDVIEAHVSLYHLSAYSLCPRSSSFLTLSFCLKQGPKHAVFFDPEIDGWKKVLFNWRPMHYRIWGEYQYFGTSLRNKWTQLCVV